MTKDSAKTTKVAVITRTKDRPLLLERAIKSVHSQTMNDFVHVIINDSGNEKIVEDLIEKNKNITKGKVKIIHNKVSRGMEAASNKAIKSVDSKYVAIHDDDDSWHPDFLKLTTEHLERTQAKGVAVTTDRVVEKVSDNKIVVLKTERWPLSSVGKINLYKQCRDNYVTPITFLYKREVYKYIGYYDESLPVAGDWDFGLRFLMHYDIDFLKTKHALAYYHHRPTSSGIDANSVFVDGGEKHKQHINLLANKYLREELKSGRLGLGYIINSLLDQRDTETESRGVLSQQVQQIQAQIADTNRHHNQRLIELESRLVKTISERTSFGVRAKGVARRLKKKQNK